MRPAVLGAVFLAFLAGCAAPESRSPSPTSPEAGGSAPIAVFEACDPACVEPNVAVDPEGRLFATTYRGDRLARSDDGGATFAALAPPPFPDDAPEAAGCADSTVDVDHAGRLFFSCLLSGEADPLPGLQVARSDDAGATWTTNVMLSLRADPVGALVGGAVATSADRQWLGFGPDGEVYLSYFQVPAGIFLARSDDGGATFGPFRPVVTAAERANGGQASPPVADDEGRVYLAYLARASALAPTQGGLAGVRVAMSDDRGETWRHVDALVAAPDETAGINFPMPVVEGDAVHVAWTDDAGRLSVLTSADRGATWAAPRPVHERPGRVPTAAWIDAHDGRIELVHYVVDAGNVTLVRASAPPDAPWEQDVVTTGIPPGSRTVAGVEDERGHARTDFADAARLPDGRLVVTWADETGAVCASTLAPLQS